MKAHQSFINGNKIPVAEELAILTTTKTLHNTTG